MLQIKHHLNDHINVTTITNNNTTNINLLTILSLIPHYTPQNMYYLERIWYLAITVTE